MFKRVLGALAIALAMSAHPSESCAQSFRLDLSLTARDLDLVTGQKTDIQTGGTIAPGRYEIEVRYRITDLVQDDSGSRGLSSALIQISFEGDLGFTLRRGVLTNYQVDPLTFGPPSNPPLNPDNTGLAPGTNTGLIGVFRGGLGSDDLPQNGVLSTSGFSCLPITLSAPGHHSWGTTGSPMPSNTNTSVTTWAIYTFGVTVPSGSGLTIRASAEPDPQTGNRFGFFIRTGTQANPVPETSLLATDATIQIGTATTRVCCLPSGACVSLLQTACAQMGGVTREPGVACAALPCCPIAVFTTQPTSRSAVVGSSVAFTGTVAGTGPFTYQWLKNGLPMIDGGRVSGATSTTLILSSVTSDDTADYRLAATDSCIQRIESQVARLTVTLCTPASGGVSGVTTITQGQPLRLFAIPSGDGPFTIQWRRNGQLLANDCRYIGATTEILTLNNASTSDSGYFDFLVTNLCGSGATVQGVDVLVRPCGPTFTLLPVTQAPLIGNSATLRVMATSTNGIVQYQWRRDGVNLPEGGRLAGVRTAELTVNGARMTDAGGYDCVVTDNCGSRVSTPAAVAPRTCPADATQNGTVTVQDVFSFVDAYLAQNCP
jgi:Immunoglobulin I-set domain